MLETKPQKTTQHTNLRISPCSGQVWTVDLKISRLRPRKGRNCSLSSFQGFATPFSSDWRWEQELSNSPEMRGASSAACCDGFVFGCGPKPVALRPAKEGRLQGEEGGWRGASGPAHTTRAPPREAAVFPHSEQPIRASCLQDLL